MTSANGNRQHRTSSAPSDSKRAARGKCKRQFITFIICVFLVGGIAGGLIVGGVQALGGNDAKEQPPYGTRDGKSVTENGELNLPELKYVAVTEVGKENGRLHHHIVMSGGVDINTLAEIWGI